MKFTRVDVYLANFRLSGGSKWGEHRDTVCSRIYDQSDNVGEMLCRYIYIAMYGTSKNVVPGPFRPAILRKHCIYGKSRAPRDITRAL